MKKKKRFNHSVVVRNEGDAYGNREISIKRFWGFEKIPEYLLVSFTEKRGLKTMNPRNWKNGVGLVVNDNFGVASVNVIK